MLGNGSDELITLLSVACDVPGASILAPLPGFVMYAMSAQLQGVTFHGVPLTANFELDEAAMLSAIATHKPAVVYLAYPNNPTGTLWSADAIERIVLAQGQQGGLIVMDEAYQPFFKTQLLSPDLVCSCANKKVIQDSKLNTMANDILKPPKNKQNEEFVRRYMVTRVQQAMFACIGGAIEDRMKNN